jgi:hypothetical protein
MKHGAKCQSKLTKEAKFKNNTSINQPKRIHKCQNINWHLIAEHSDRKNLKEKKKK